MNQSTDHPDGPRAGSAPSREDRLAAKLRENLRRRKAQARALGADPAPAAGPAAAHGESDAALPKSPPSG